MNNNIYLNLKKYISEWQNVLTNEMSKFWGKVSISELIQDTFNQYLTILQTNFQHLKNGTLTAEQVKKNISDLNLVFKNSVNKMNNDISDITRKKFSNLIKND